MLVFWKEKLVFLAVAKTGTTALEGALAPKAAMIVRDPPILKHTPVYRYNRFLRPYLEKGGADDLETMAVVRHPVSWLGSWYRYRARDDLKGHPNSTAQVSFDTFVDEYTKGKPAEFANVGSPSKFLRTGDGEIGVDHLFQYEQMDKVIGFFEQRLQTKVELSRKNVSPAMELTLSPKTQAKLERKCADFYALWEAGHR